jgi:hypothetical protein
VSPPTLAAGSNQPDTVAAPASQVNAAGAENPCGVPISGQACYLGIARDQLGDRDSRMNAFKLCAKILERVQVDGAGRLKE